MTRTVLLFGATGFLGRHVRASLAGGGNLICPTRAECDLVAADVPALTRYLARIRPDAVVNCAGRITGSGTELVEAHTLVAGKLIEAVAAAIPRSRLVRIGSAAEYGPVAGTLPIRETDPGAPASEYGVSQLAASQLVGLAATTGRVDAVVLRVFNPIGPGLPDSNVLGRARRLIDAAMRSGADHIALGLLPSHRDFIDVRDVAAAVQRAVRVPELPDRVFNIGSGRAVAVRDALETLARVARFDGEIRDGPVHPTAARSAGVPWICADPRRAADQLGWTSRYDLTESLTWLWTEAEPQ